MSVLFQFNQSRIDMEIYVQFYKYFLVRFVEI